MAFIAVPTPAAGGNPNYTYPNDSTFCLKVQQNLNDISLNAPSNTRDTLGLLEYLRSPMNNGSLEQIRLNASNGNYRKVQMKRRKRYSKAQATTVSNPSPSQCIPTGIYREADGTQDIVVDRKTSLTTAISRGDMAQFCESSDVQFANEINDMINAVLSAVNDELATLMLTQFGQYRDTSATKTFNINTATVPPGIDNDEVLEMQLELTDGGLRGPYYLVGGKQTLKAMRKSGVGCCNQFGTIITPMSNDFRFYYDPNVEAIWGNTHNLLSASGVAQLVTWDPFIEFVDERDVKEFVFTDPFTGVDMFMNAVWSNTCKFWTIEIGMYYTLWTVPPSGNYIAGDSNPDTYNGLLRALIP